jgi:hypothetical protein
VFDPSNPLVDYSQKQWNLNASGTPPVYQTNEPWVGTSSAVFRGGQYLQAPTINLGEMSTGPGFSICCWIKFQNLSRWAIALDFGNSDLASNMLLGAGGNKLENGSELQCQKYCSGRPMSNFAFPKLLTQNEWRHVCIVNRNTSWSYYDSGVLVGTDQQCLDNKAFNSNFIGKTNFGQYFEGSIAEFRVYNRALSSSEVTQVASYQGSVIPLYQDGSVPECGHCGDDLSLST